MRCTAPISRTRRCPSIRGCASACSSGKAIGAADYIDELAERAARRGRFADWMRGRDALLTPTLPITATPVADVDESTTPLATFTRAANYLGACALSLPAGFVRGGLPIGVQLMGAPFAEATLVAHRPRVPARDRLAPAPAGPDGVVLRTLSNPLVRRA